MTVNALLGPRRVDRMEGRQGIAELPVAEKVWMDASIKECMGCAAETVVGMCAKRSHAGEAGADARVSDGCAELRWLQIE